MKRRFLILAWALTGSLSALPPWLSLGGGLKAGVGPSQFYGENHLPPPCMACLFNGVTQERRGSLSGQLGAYLSARFSGFVGLQAEIGVVQDGGSSVETIDAFTPITRETGFEREAWEWPILLKLGWPVDFPKLSIYPYASGGLWGNVLISARKRLSIDAGPSSEAEWKGAPAADHGWCAGLGLETLIKGSPVLRTLGLEVRYREGFTDLDPKGNFAQKARSLNIVLSLGY